MQGSAHIIVAHNHPSGMVDPSDEDMQVTRLLLEAGKLLGITMLDHLIFTPTSFYSFKEYRVEQIREIDTRGAVSR
jgi:DNA repair protein RadC